MGSALKREKQGKAGSAVDALPHLSCSQRIARILEGLLGYARRELARRRNLGPMMSRSITIAVLLLFSIFGFFCNTMITLAEPARRSPLTGI